MKELKAIISKDAPRGRDIIWLKPLSDGFAVYALFGGKWQPLKLVDDNGAAGIADDTTQNLIGSVQDESSANTINGAKAYAKDVADAVVGTDADESTDMTLYGLKAYVDAQIAGLG